MSILSSPTPNRPTTSNCGAAARSSPSTCVLLRTIKASASVRRRLSLSRCAPRSASDATSNRAASAATTAGSMNSLMTTRMVLIASIRSDSAWCSTQFSTQFSTRVSTQFSTLHAPLANGPGFDGAKNDVLDQQADDDHGKQAGEYIRDLELILVLVDEPSKNARPGRDPEHQLARDQGAPGECPADLESGQDTRECRGNEDACDVR